MSKKPKQKCPDQEIPSEEIETYEFSIDSEEQESAIEDSATPKTDKKTHEILQEKLYEFIHDSTPEIFKNNRRALKDLFEFSHIQCSLDDKRQNYNLRKSLAIGLTVGMAIWLSIVLIIIFLVGFNVMTLSEPVLITLISSTTIDIIGLVAIIVRNLFPNTSLPRKKKRKSTKNKD